MTFVSHRCYFLSIFIQTVGKQLFCCAAVGSLRQLWHWWISWSLGNEVMCCVRQTWTVYYVIRLEQSYTGGKRVMGATPYKQPVVSSRLFLYILKETEEKQCEHTVGYCLKSIGCWIWPVSCWSHLCVCVLWMMCSVTAGLTGKHEVREDVKRKGLLRSSWRLVIITHWHSNGLISPFTTKKLWYSTTPYHSATITILCFSSSYMLFMQIDKNGSNYMCEGGVAFTRSGVREWTWSIKSFKGETFTCKKKKKKTQPVRHPRICPLLLPPCVQMFPDRKAAGTLVH